MSRLIKKVFFLIICGLVLTVPTFPALSAPSNPLDPYIEAAKKEGSVNLGITLQEKSHGKPAGSLYLAAFQKQYPFLKVNFKRVGGTRERERIIAEMTSGLVDFDVVTVSEPQIATIVDAKLPRAVEWEKLGVPKIIIHPKNYGITMRILTYGIAYNRDLISDAVAKTFTWETCMEPKWKGKIAMNDQVQHLLRLYRDDGWGRAKTLDYAKRWAATKPVLNASLSDGAEKVNMGSYAMLCGMARGQVQDIQINAGSKSIGIVYPEPVPTKIGDLIYVPVKAKHPNAAILFMVWSSTKEAQNLIDETEFAGDPRAEGSKIQADLKGKKVLYPTAEASAHADDDLAEIFQAMGFPVVR
jgi:ABC-type Fe3+ transport system substrate-binding protein